MSKHLDTSAIDLIEKMLIWDPKKRITAMGALNHAYFNDKDCLPCEPSELPIIQGELKELQFREERNRKIRENMNGNIVKR